MARARSSARVAFWCFCFLGKRIPWACSALSWSSTQIPDIGSYQEGFCVKIVKGVLAI